MKDFKFFTCTIVIRVIFIIFLNKNLKLVFEHGPDRTVDNSYEELYYFIILVFES